MPSELPVNAPLTFDTAMALLLQRNTTLVQDRSTISRNHLNYQTVAAGYAPDWQARLIGNAQPPLDSTVANQVGAYNDQLGAEIQWTAPWWHKEGVRYDAASAQLDVAGAENTYRADQQDQAVTLYKDYIAVRQYQEKVRVSQSQLDVDRARRNSMAQGAQIGQTAGLSVIIQEANLQNQQATTAQLQDQLFQKWATLFAQLNVSPGKVSLCKNYFNFAPYDPAMTSAQAIAEQTRALKIQIAKQQVQLRKAGITWQPELSVRASYGRELQENVPGSQHDVGNIGVILTIPFPNSSQLTGQQGLAEHDLNDLFQHLDQTTQSTQRTDTEDRTRILTLANNLRFRQQAMKENQQRLAETRRSFQLGLITYLDLQTVENSIVQSTEDYYDDLATYLDLIADYARLHGQPLPVPHTCVPETGGP